MTAEGRKGLKDAGSSNVNHVSRKSLQCIDEGPEGRGGGGVGSHPVPSIEIIQSPSPNMKKRKIPSLEAVVP